MQTSQANNRDCLHTSTTVLSITSLGVQFPFQPHPVRRQQSPIDQPPIAQQQADFLAPTSAEPCARSDSVARKERISLLIDMPPLTFCDEDLQWLFMDMGLILVTFVFLSIRNVAASFVSAIGRMRYPQYGA